MTTYHLYLQDTNVWGYLLIYILAQRLFYHVFYRFSTSLKRNCFIKCPDFDNIYYQNQHTKRSIGVRQ